jgi:hypothetical protein
MQKRFPKRSCWLIKKDLCKQSGYVKSQKYKLYAFSAILDIYFTMNYKQAQAAMNGSSCYSNKTKNRTTTPISAIVTSSIPVTLSTYEIRVKKLTERAGFEPAVLNKEHTGFRNQLDQPLRHLSETDPAAAIPFAETSYSIRFCAPNCKNNRPRRNMIENNSFLLYNRYWRGCSILRLIRWC